MRTIIEVIFVDLFSFLKETFNYLPSNIWSIFGPCYLEITIQKQINLSKFQNSIQFIYRQNYGQNSNIH